MPFVRLPIDLRSVGQARALLHQALHQNGAQTARVPPADVAANAELILSELVTNALRHAHDLVLLEIRLSDDTLRVAVIDDGPGLPSLRAEDHNATGGRGMVIVDALADRWGTTADTDSKSVWFELALP